MMALTRMTMGELRDIIVETMALVPDAGNRWVVTADAVSSMGFETRRESGSSNVVGYGVKGVWAPFQALKDMDAKALTVMLGRPVPEGVTANDMLKVVKTMQPVTTESGVTLVPQPGLQDKVTHLAAIMTYKRFADAKIDLVVTPQSSSRFAARFGEALATLLEAKHVDAGVVKSLANITLELPDHVKDTKTGQDAVKALERWKNALRQGRAPSLRSTFKPSIRQHVKGFMDVGDEMMPWLGEGPKRVLLADDVVTTGSTHGDSTRALEEMGFEVVARVAAIKEQSTPAKKKKAA